MSAGRAPRRARPRPPAKAEPLTFALPKGRVAEQLAPLLASVGIDASDVLASDRRLVRTDPRTGMRFLLLKPDDVPTWVEYGAADLGVVGRDVLLEREYDVYAPVDLGIGRCRLVVAGKDGAVRSAHTLRVATKFPGIAARHFARAAVPVEVIYVQGSVELAPLTGLADVIVDLVESGRTLRENGLVVLEPIAEVSSVVITNRTAMKLRRRDLAPILRGLDPEARSRSPAARPRARRR